jgi:hypothetical protein
LTIDVANEENTRIKQIDTARIVVDRQKKDRVRSEREKERERKRERVRRERERVRSVSEDEGGKKREGKRVVEKRPF